MKTLKQIAATASLALLLAGCATTDSQNSGGVGSGSESGYGSQSSQSVQPVLPVPMGQNGSIGAGNPLGLGNGSYSN